jgi:translation initiation factor IF-1
MAKECGVEVDGTVAEARGNGFFLVRLDNDFEVLARPCGKMTRCNIKVTVDDRVRVEIGPYDLGRGRIKFRYK